MMNTEPSVDQLATDLKRGRPKVIWILFKQQLWRLARTQELPKTASAAAKYLAGWAKERGIKTGGAKPASPKAQAIYKRLCRRLGGAKNYPNFVIWLAGCNSPPEE